MARIRPEFLLYPVANGRLVNMVAFVPTDTE